MFRRKFIKTLFSNLLAVQFSSLFALKKQAFAVGNRKVQISIPVPKLSKYGNFNLLYGTNIRNLRHWCWASFNSESKLAHLVPLNFSNAHSIVLSSRINPKFCFISGGMQRGSCLVSIGSGKVVKTIEPEDKSNIFSGHGAFSPDEKYIFVGEYPKDLSGAGKLCVRSLPGLQVVKRISTGLWAPHDIKMSHDNRHLIVGHLGMFTKTGIQHGGCAIFSFPSLEPVKGLPVFSHLNFQHIAVSPMGDILFSARYVKGKKEVPAPVVFGRVDSASWATAFATGPDESFLYNFTPLYLPDEDMFVVSHRQGSCISFWSRKTRSFIKSVEIKRSMPSAIAAIPNSSYILVGTHPLDLLYVVDVRKFSVVDIFDFPGISDAAHFCIYPA